MSHSAENSSVVLHEKQGLVEGRILRRYKRFLADAELDSGENVVAHCTNTGTMASCWEPGDTVLLEPNDNPRRKLRYTWVACRRGNHWVGVDTGVPNRVVAEAARRDILPGLPGLHNVLTEVRYGNERSRVDVLAEDELGRSVYIEVKNTTLRTESPAGAIVSFPDAVTARGLKHLRELQAMVDEGHRAAIIFFVHRDDVRAFRPARDIDPAYADELDRARSAGVEVLPLQARITTGPGDTGLCTLQWTLDRPLPIV
jgi:sugar fermentation stimulation protein A